MKTFANILWQAGLALNITIKDIAREAHVSYATVSRAFNNRDGVRSETRDKVLKIANRLNYSPNGIARGLVLKQTKTIGLVIPDITNPFFPEVARGIEEGAKEEGYSVFLCNTNWEQERQFQYIKLLAEKRVDGLIIAPMSDAPDPEGERLHGSIPVVYVDRAPQNTDRSYVVIDNVRGGFIATRHLIEAGYRKIGFIGAVEQSLPIDERLKGFRMAMERYGLPIDERFIRIGHFNQETGVNFIEGMIKEGDYPQAVFAENDIVALGVIHGVREMGLSVPGDVAVVGFDDISIASLHYIKLTTVVQPKYEMGKAAVKFLLDEIGVKAGSTSLGAAGHAEMRKSAEPSRRVVILEPRLIIRKTSIIT